MATKKKTDIIEQLAQQSDQQSLHNPLLMALVENDKKNMFKTNVTTTFHKTGFHLFDYYFGSVINVHDETGKIISQEPRIGQAAGTFNLIVGSSGSGKAQPVSTKIPSPNGFVRMGDLVVGDEVFASSAKPTKVTGVYPQGKKEIYRVTLMDGRSTLCCKEHLWNVSYRERHNDKYISKYDTVPLQTIIDNFKEGQYAVPILSAPIEYNAIPKELKVDPYLLGLFLNQTMEYSEPLMINTEDHRLVWRIEAITNYTLFQSEEDCDEWYISGKRRPDGNNIRTNTILNELYEVDEYGKLSKRIPNQYLYASVKNRMLLLNGILDSGTIIKENNEYDSTWVWKCNIDATYSSVLCNQIKTLCHGLGLKIVFDAPIKNEKHITAYINIDNGVLDLYRNCDKADYDKTLMWYTWSDSYHFERIKEIEYSHDEEAVCIMVSDDKHLYVTEDFIITHNTTLAIQISGNIIRQYKYANVIHYDCENRIDISRCENITRLPAHYFGSDGGAERYMIKGGAVGLDTIQEMIVKTYVSKMKLKDVMQIDSGFKDEFGNPVKVFMPTIIIIDSITTVMNESFNPNNSKEASDAERMRSNTEGARDAKTLKGFFKDILPLCKEANIIVYGINHVNNNMSMNAFVPVAKQQNYLKQDEIIPGGKTMIYYPFNIIKLTARPSDDFTEESDGFAGHMVMVEPIKSSSNQSGNNSKGVSFEMAFSHKQGFDPLRTILLYGRDRGIIEGNKNRMKFKEDDSFTFNLKEIYKEKETKPIWEDINKYIVPTLKEHLSFIEPTEAVFDDRGLDY